MWLLQEREAMRQLSSIFLALRLRNAPKNTRAIRSSERGVRYKVKEVDESDDVMRQLCPAVMMVLCWGEEQETHVCARAEKWQETRTPQNRLQDSGPGPTKRTKSSEQQERGRL